ncbi:GTP-binding protein, putative [Entamoeba histolytica KU27]|uniref:GTP-binding protein, putative n=2 Tax=Entamoeba histolytica TaxID=5759 RepID=M2Q198_ENTHI|nr:GTP-binding protein, putative [Entamoeba histolytica KU27]
MASRFKIVIMGDNDVGKSSILKRFVEDTWSDEKPENQFKGVYINKEITVNNHTIKFDIVDLAFDVEATASDFSGAKASIAVFDYSSPDTIQGVRSFIGFTNRFVSDDKFFTCIVGNKADLEKKVEESAIEAIKTSLNISKVYECSAKTGAGVKEMFEDIAKNLIERNAPVDNKKEKKAKKEKKKGCLLL